MSLRNFLIAGLIALIPLGFLFARDKTVRLGVEVAASNQVSMDQVDHGDWTQLLKQFVDEEGRVDYEKWAKSKEANAQLDRYLRQLSSASLTLPAKIESRLAFWINAYNAVTIKGILREYPTTSIRNHTSRIGGYNLWHHLLLKVGGKEWSLDAIEHKVLRPMGEPRIHFAIVCASKGCPRLLNEAYVGSKLNRQLELNAQVFFSRPIHLQYDAKSNTLYTSSILNWFGADFGQSQKQILERVETWLPEQIKTTVDWKTVKVKYLKYDWSLNDKS